MKAEQFNNGNIRFIFDLFCIYFDGKFHLHGGNGLLLEDFYYKDGLIISDINGPLSSYQFAYSIYGDNEGSISLLEFKKNKRKVLGHFIKEKNIWMNTEEKMNEYKILEPVMFYSNMKKASFL
jgi:hypothetical protein